MAVLRGTDARLDGLGQKTKALLGFSKSSASMLYRMLYRFFAKP